MTIRELAAREYGQGMESAGAETAFWAALPTMPVNRVATLVRELELGQQFKVVAAAITGANQERMAAFKAAFSQEELAAMRRLDE
jgi:hypothetical protein